MDHRILTFSFEFISCVTFRFDFRCFVINFYLQMLKCRIIFLFTARTCRYALFNYFTVWKLLGLHNIINENKVNCLIRCLCFCQEWAKNLIVFITIRNARKVMFLNHVVIQGTFSYNVQKYAPKVASRSSYVF